MMAVRTGWAVLDYAAQRDAAMMVQATDFGSLHDLTHLGALD